MCETEKGIDEGKRCGRTKTAEYKPVLFRVEREFIFFFYKFRVWAWIYFAVCDTNTGV